MTARIREDLESIPPYVPGRNFPGAIKLASNETTLGPLPSVSKAIAEAVESANRYPDNGSVELVTALADSLGVAPENVAAGCGSVAICQELVAITCVPGDEVLYAWRAFEAYPVVTKVAGATEVTVPLDADHVHDLDAIAAAITPRTRLIFVCNPNNPTGTAVGRRALERFLDSVPAEILVVLDEAYLEYVRIPVEDRADGVELGRSRPNVVVLRTFSKAYGLAGLRVGYAVGDPEIIRSLSKVHVPFSVSRVAQAAAIASLEAQAELLDRTDAVVAERNRVRTALLDAGYLVAESEANFVWLPLGDRAVPFATLLAQSDVLVRPFAGDGVRVTIGDPHENDAFLTLATKPDALAAFSG
ncbi:histidinol-phosphate transaminase [Antrihabitans cavernicola]|uniref:Aromatic amino acid aminotransferase n=1 Tax=Antrihabitans cavernicola TaxID=2495913 RepID=A0A5A7SJH7_9NOCA|nr:histidinol-phosphate transaminase [Spelaeibacter cavernicola]KAA0024585.1 histidinol-phosphate transaminase [Spelaeibacter cavernicola]